VPSLTTILVFCGAAIALLVVPGPSVLYIVTRSIEHGRRAGFVSVLGVHAGTIVHVVAAALGLSALLVSSAVAFTAVKYAGAAYLLWLGVQRWRAGERSFDDDAVHARPLPADRHVLRQGFLVNLLNPKTAIFFLAFLPQFIDVDRGPVALQAVVLGLIFIALGIVSDGTYALIASRLGEALRRNRRARRAERYVSTGVYVGLGVSTAVTGGAHSRAG
jgi:threonine/homoserine/homoserine lactone efflux protein